MTLLRTRYRVKVATGFSYPVGAEILSRALAGVPQFTALSITFYDRPLIFASDYRAALQAGRPLPVVTAAYRHVRPGLTGSNDMIEGGWYGENWALTVYPVSSDKRHIVRHLLIATGLPAEIGAREAMNHYQRLAIVLVRCAGGAAVAAGLLGFVYGTVLVARGVSLSSEQAERFGSSVWYVGFGLILCLLGRRLGSLLGRGLD